MHKTLNELIAGGVLIKDTQGSTLNTEWIKKQKGAFDNIDSLRSQKLRQKGNALVLNFNSYKEWGRMMLQLLKSNCDFLDGNHFYCVFKHMWMTLSFENDEYQWFLDVTSPGAFIICIEDSPLDQVIAGLWRKVGLTINFGINYPCNYDFAVYGDKVFQVFFSNELKNAIDKLFANAKTIESITSKEYYETYYGNLKTTVAIIENKQLADQLKEDVKKYFKE